MPTTKPLASKANLFCFRCQVKLGKILNRGTFCPICRRKICSKCLASANLKGSFCQTNLTHQTLINYKLTNQKNATRLDTGLKQPNDGTNDKFSNSKHILLNNNNNNNSPEVACLNSERCLSNSPLNKSKSNASIDATQTDVNLNEIEQPKIDRNAQHTQLNQNNQNNQLHAQANEQRQTVRNDGDDQQIPKKTQRKNTTSTGRYIKRATSNTADSLAARRYRCNLRSNTTREETTVNQNLNGNKQLSKSCTELTQPAHQTTDQSDYSIRCTSEQNLNQNSNDGDQHNLDVQFDKTASLPKFKSLNRLISKLKRSHTIGNVNDLGKRSALFSYPSGSNSLKVQTGHKSSSTIWRRSSAKTLAVGHQIYLKTLNLGKKSLFKRQSPNVTGIPICKLKGICSFCCKKITSESLSLNQTIGYSFGQITNHSEVRTDDVRTTAETTADRTPIPPVRKSNLVKSNSQKADNRRPAKMPIKPERQFIVQRCVLEQSCSMGELNIKQLDQISDQDSGLQTNSLEALDQKTNPRKNHRATTLPKTSMLFGRPLDSEKRGTLKVRSHIEMNEDGTFYVQDSDWEMTSESDHWQKSDQFSSISSTELNELSCEYFRLNTGLCKDKLLRNVTVDNERSSDTLCRNSPSKPEAKRKDKPNTGSKHGCSTIVDTVECAKSSNSETCSNDECGSEQTVNVEQSANCLNEEEDKLNVVVVEQRPAEQCDGEQSNNNNGEERTNDTQLDYERNAIKELKRDQLEANKRRLDTFMHLNTNSASKVRQCSKNIKIKSNARPMHRANSVGENMNESELKSTNRLNGTLPKHIKRSFSETVLHFDDVNSADDELDEDEEDDKQTAVVSNLSTSSPNSPKEHKSPNSPTTKLASNGGNQDLVPCIVVSDHESNRTSNETSSSTYNAATTNLSFNNPSSSYCLSTYSLKKEQCKMPDQALDFFSSDDQSIEHNQLTKHGLLNEARAQSPMLDLDSTQTEDETSRSSLLNDKLEQSNDEYIEHDSIEDDELMKNYNLYQPDDYQTNKLESSDFRTVVDQPDCQSTDFDGELNDRLVQQQQRHHITSLENLFSLETIQEQDEEDYSLKDQSSLRSNASQQPEEDESINERSSGTKLNNQTTNHDVSNIDLSNFGESNEINESNDISNDVLNHESNDVSNDVSNHVSNDVSNDVSNHVSNDVLNSEKSELQDESTHSQISSTRSQDTEELINNIYKKICVEDEDTTSTDYKRYRTFKRDFSVENDPSNRATECDSLDGEDPFNSLSECAVDENVTIEDQQIVVIKRLESNEESNRNSTKLDQLNRKQQATKPEICKRSSLIHRNIEQLDKSKKKINDMLQFNKIEPRSRVSDLLNRPSTRSSYTNTSPYSKTAKKELNESGIYMDQIEDNQTRKQMFKQSREAIPTKSNRTESSHLNYLEGSSGVDSGPPSSEENRDNNFELIKSTRLIKSISKAARKDDAECNESTDQPNRSSPLLKSKSMYNVDQQFSGRTPSTDHRLSSEEFNRRRRSYEVNLDCLEQDHSRTGLMNLRRKSTNYLLNQSFNQLSNDDIARIKKELIRRSEERLARFESSISSKSNANSVNNSIIESIANSKRDESVAVQKTSQSSDENLDEEYQNRRISRKQLNDKWRDTLKRSDSLDSINSIKSLNSMGSLTNDDLSNMKVISRTKIKSTIGYGALSDEYDCSTNPHYVLNDQLTSGRYRLTENSLLSFNRRSMESQMEPRIGKRRLDLGALNEFRLNKPANYESREEDNDYDELVENSYVEMSYASDNRSANNHTYKMISERENPYEFESDLQDENPYISLKDDFLPKNDYENLQALRDDLRELDDEYQNFKVRSTDHLPPYSTTTVIQRRESFHQPAYQPAQVKLPLKRSKSVPASTLSPKYLNNKSTMNGKASLLSASRTSKTKDDSYLIDQLEFQKKHLQQLHKQHWKYRLRNANENDDYTSLFTLDQENMNRPYELLVAHQFNEDAKEIRLFIKECRNFGNLTDKYVKVYLLPDKQSKQRTSLQSKTIGHVNNLIERKSFSICSPVINKEFRFHCEELEELSNSRSLFLSVWKNKKSILEKNQCLGELFLKVTRSTGENDKLEDKSSSDDLVVKNSNIKFDLEDESSKQLQYNWTSLDQSFHYSGEIDLSMLYDSNKNQLKIEVIGCLNLLTRKRDLRTLNTFCKVELKRSSIDTTDKQVNSTNDDALHELNGTQDTNNNSKENEKQVRFLVNDTLEKRSSLPFSLIDCQKTVIIKNSLCPKYNKLFIFNDIQSDRLEQYALELTIWCQSLTTPYLISGVQLGKTNAMMHVRKSSTSDDEESRVWQQVLDKTKFNKWIKARLQLRPID